MTVLVGVLASVQAGADAASGPGPATRETALADTGQAGPPPKTCGRLLALQTPSGRLCTHGPDAPPAGVDLHRSVAPVAAKAVKTGIQCDGKGTTGNRTEVIYARAADVPDRYDAYLDSFRTWAVEADGIYRNSAAETGGFRRVRFVHDAKCSLIVRHVVLSPSGDDDFGATITELQAQGYGRTDRKYMVFVDAYLYCGIGTVNYDDQPGVTNQSNFGPSYGRSDAGCWTGWVAAHEHMHNLGGVQLTAPHTSGGWHCADEYDVMCYSDSPYYPPMSYVCPDTAHELLFDCNHDDYFNTSPSSGSYLADHWNIADSVFLLTQRHSRSR